MNLPPLPTKHQVAVAGTHVTVSIISIIGAAAYFGVLSPAQVQDATNDVHRIAADLGDLYTAIAGLAGIAITAYATIRSGPLASLFRAVHDIAGDPVKMEQVGAAATGITTADKASLVAVTDKLPEVAKVITANTPDGQKLADAVPSPTVTTVGAVNVVKVLLLALLVSSALLMSFPAMAQTKPHINLPFDPLHLNTDSASGTSGLGSGVLSALAKPFKDLANFIGEDANQAIALSTAIPDIQDGHGQQCWMAMAQFGEIVKAHPVPLTFHAINDYENLRLLAIATNNLCSNVHCTQVFADASAMAQAASPVPLPIPSLHDLCTKVPQIALVAPVALPVAVTAPAK